MGSTSNYCTDVHGRFINTHVDSLIISGNMNNISYFVDINVDVLDNDSKSLIRKVIYFTYDYIDDSCYSFHDEKMNFYNSDDFRIDDIKKIKKKLKGIIYPKLIEWNS
jgi:hypothetical protein